ncbi:MAG: LOG family protein [Phycisphaerales bacterium]|nr:LOG family protein [Phycisphaerales bacterium]
MNTHTPRIAPHLRTAIDAIVDLAAPSDRSDPAFAQRRLVVAEMVATSLRLFDDGLTTGELRLVRQALREMRAGFTMFHRFRTLRKIAIFGSARTPREHPDYRAAVEFSRLLAERGWMAITGAGPGIMQAGIEGPTPERAFGLSIRLPFEDKPNPVIANDPKLLTFRYFFTRKLAFMGNADAVAAFPGGFGTQDELFEALTLVQTGRNAIIPIVLVEGHGEDGHALGYWKKWEGFVRGAMHDTGWISREDEHLYRIARSPTEATEIVAHYYLRYQSSRYVDDRFVIRLDAPLPSHSCAEFDRDFGELLASGGFSQGDTFEGDDAPGGTPRLWFRHNRKHIGLLRRLIDRINDTPQIAAT